MSELPSISEFRKYRNSSSSSPGKQEGLLSNSFRGTVIQVVVHLIATGSEMLSRFGGTVIQVVAHQT